MRLVNVPDGVDWYVHDGDGYDNQSWDKTLFPKPGALMDTLHRKKLLTTLNLHPASGVLPYEDCYVDMAKAMGQDPSNKIYGTF